MALSRKPVEIVDEGKHQLLVKAGHWERVPLSDVAEVQNGFAFKSEYFTHTEGKPLIRIRDIDQEQTENRYAGDYQDEFLVKKGDILIGMDGDFNAAIWRGDDGLLNQRVCRLSLTTNLYLKKFLFLCLQPYLNAIHAETSAVTVKHLSSRTVGEIPLPLPPLNEQHRIVAKIEELFSELDKSIESLKTAQAQLKIYRQALLKHAFEGKLTAQWRAENPDKLESADALLKRIQQERAQRYQQQLANWEANGRQGGKPKVPKALAQFTADELAELPELPEGWAWLRVQDLADKVTDGEHITPKRTPVGYFLLSARNIQNGRLDLSDVDYVPKDEYERIRKRCDPEEGDILISCSGSIGRICRVPKDLDFVMVRSVAVIKMQSAKGYSKFYEFLFQSPLLQRQIEKGKKATAQANLFLDPIKNLKILVCSTEEQMALVTELESRLIGVGQLEQTLDTSLQQAEALRQSILKKAFSGKLVPQDLNDEPASVLLARIKAEKASQTPSKKART